MSIRIAKTKPPAAGEPITVHADGHDVAVFAIGGSLYAIDGKCTHVGGPLAEGMVEGTVVTCPWHGSQFDLATGAVREGPAQRPVKAYTVKVDGDDLLLDPKG